VRCRCRNSQRSRDSLRKPSSDATELPPTATMEVETGIQPPWIRLQTEALVTTWMQSLSLRQSIQAWLTNALRTRTACIYTDQIDSFHIKSTLPKCTLAKCKFPQRASHPCPPTFSHIKMQGLVYCKKQANITAFAFCKY
jgi:hypothetical protein